MVRIISFSDCRGIFSIDNMNSLHIFEVIISWNVNTTFNEIFSNYLKNYVQKSKTCLYNRITVNSKFFAELPACLALMTHILK